MLPKSPCATVKTQHSKRKKWLYKHLTVQENKKPKTSQRLSCVQRLLPPFCPTLVSPDPGCHKPPSAWRVGLGHPWGDSSPPAHTPGPWVSAPEAAFSWALLPELSDSPVTLPPSGASRMRRAGGVDLGTLGAQSCQECAGWPRRGYSGSHYAGGQKALGKYHLPLGLSFLFCKKKPWGLPWFAGVVGLILGQEAKTPHASGPKKKKKKKHKTEAIL